MNNIIWIISTILTLNVVAIVLKEVYSNNKRKQNKDATNNILRPNKLFFIVGVCGFVILTGLTIMGYFLDKTTPFLEKWIYIGLLFLFIILLYGYLMMFYLNYRIVVFEDHFIYQNFWHIKKTIYYKDIEINRTKIYPQIRQKQTSGKTRLIFKLAGILENEDAFMIAYKNWKSKQKSKN